MLVPWLLLGIPYLTCWYVYFNTKKYLLLSEVAQGAMIFGIIIPPLGAVVGLWYLIFGPTESRVTRKVAEGVATLSNEKLVEWINNTVIEGRLHDDPWVQKSWEPLTIEQRIGLVETNRDRLLELYVPMFSQTPRVPYPTIIAMVEKAFSPASA
jgi:hypothetical protein